MQNVSVQLSSMMQRMKHILQRKKSHTAFMNVKVQESVQLNFTVSQKMPDLQAFVLDIP